MVFFVFLRIACFVRMCTPWSSASSQLLDVLCAYARLVGRGECRGSLHYTPLEDAEKGFRETCVFGFWGTLMQARCCSFIIVTVLLCVALLR